MQGLACSCGRQYYVHVQYMHVLCQPADWTEILLWLTLKVNIHYLNENVHRFICMLFAPCVYFFVCPRMQGLVSVSSKLHILPTCIKMHTLVVSIPVHVTKYNSHSQSSDSCLELRVVSVLWVASC